MSEKELKLTDLDYAIGDHHLQMMKAALPYMDISQQRIISLFVKWNELVRTMEFFDENGEGMMSVCSLDEGHVTPVDMLTAVKPYGNQKEQEFIDILVKVLSNRSGRNSGKNPVSADQLITLLPPEMQSRIETMQLMIQTMMQV